MTQREYVRRRRIRSVASSLLEQADIKEPPVSVADIAQAQGLQVRLQKDDDSGVSGFIFIGQSKPIIGVNASHHENRQRFTIAHELGHYLLHRADQSDLHIDHGFQVKLRDDLSSEGTDLEEREANLFAAELLMPVNFLKGDLQDRDRLDLEEDDFLRELARRYQVSLQAMVFRLTNLGYLSV